MHTTRILVFLVLATASSYVSAAAVFRSNYDVVLTVEGNRYHAQSRAQVRDGHAIPVQFHDYRIEIAISSVSDEEYSVVVNILENSRGSWYQLNDSSLSFEGGFGIPVEYRWSSAGVELDIAIIVSVLHQ
jgi:transcriptional regulator of NAD metabolism